MHVRIKHPRSVQRGVERIKDVFTAGCPLNAAYFPKLCQFSERRGTVQCFLEASTQHVEIWKAVNCEEVSHRVAENEKVQQGVEKVQKGLEVAKDASC